MQIVVRLKLFYLTLTSVVFELITPNAGGVSIINLTLTSVVFESIIFFKNNLVKLHLTLTSVVFECFRSVNI